MNLYLKEDINVESKEYVETKEKYEGILREWRGKLMDNLTNSLKLVKEKYPEINCRVNVEYIVPNGPFYICTHPMFLARFSTKIEELEILTKDSAILTCVIDLDHINIAGTGRQQFYFRTLRLGKYISIDYERFLSFLESQEEERIR